ncbi:hypothetical protein GCM10020000_06140 [Streptomyces olivoverticillatus]
MIYSALPTLHMRRSLGLADEEWDMQWRAWGEAARIVQAAITEHARAGGLNRFEVEAAVKRAARHSK